MCADDSWNNEAGQVLAGEAGLDEARSVVNHEVLLLVEEYLHILKSLLNRSHLIQILYFAVLTIIIIF